MNQMRHPRRLAALSGTLLLALAIPNVARAQINTLVTFDGSNGSAPEAGLLQGLDGNLYGTTPWGGANYNYSCDQSYCGNVFKMSPTGRLTTIYNFCAEKDCTDGATPYAPLAQAPDGNLYGTTVEGGASGYGTVYKLNPEGTLTKLHDFCASNDCSDGTYPSGLFLANDGDFYGTTMLAGEDSGDGTVFKVSSTGAFTTLYTFCPQLPCTDGAFPRGGVIQAADGNFYGVTSAGGAANWGTVFKLTPAGNLTTLYSFCSQANCADGSTPQGGLVEGRDGDLYGTTQYGGGAQGCAVGCGTVFKITTAGTLTTLHVFCGVGRTCGDGEYPWATLMQATNGDFYGTTVWGGDSCSGSGCGVLFGMSPDGSFNLVAAFNKTDGADPYDAPFEATNGILYATTSSGGGYQGTIIGLNLALSPFVEILPARGKVGTEVRILGTNLAGATSVTFAGVSTAFTVGSNSLIVATVPAGAITGPVRVVTPGGTLTSNVSFRVTP